MNDLPSHFILNEKKYNIKEISVLKNFKPTDLCLEPFSHLVIKNCLNKEIYDHLEKTYPSDDLIFKMDENDHKKMLQNTRYQINANTSLNEYKKIDDIWILFIKYHSSKLFLEEVKNIFSNFNKIDIIKNKINYINKENIQNNKKLYKLIKKSIFNISNQIKNPNLEELTQKKDILMAQIKKRVTCNDLMVGIRYKDDTDILLDCQIGINSPCKNKSTVKMPHIDNLNEIYAGLFYMKHPDDKGEGGDLIIYEPNEKYKNFNDYRSQNPFVKMNNFNKGKFNIEVRGFKEDTLNQVKKIKYDKNVFVLFLSTINSIHAVSPREINKISRRLVNIIGESYSKENLNRY
jgi:hypothetical protein